MNDSFNKLKLLLILSVLDPLVIKLDFPSKNGKSFQVSFSLIDNIINKGIIIFLKVNSLIIRYLIDGLTD